MSYIDKLESMYACEPALLWLRTHQFPTLQDAWDVCERGDWMLWFIGKTSNPRDEDQLRKLTLVKARCAKLTYHLMSDIRSRNAVDVSERFGLGQATRGELDYAAHAAADAAHATADAAAADAAAAYAAAYAAKYDVLRKCANIVREEYRQAPEII